VRDYKRLVGVDGAPVLGAHHVGVNIESINLAARSVTAIPVSVTSIAGVEGGGDGVFVPLHDVVLGAPDVVTKVGIAVVISITWVVPWHVDEVGSSVTVATNIAEVQSVGEMLVIERSLPVSVRIPAIYCTVAEIQPGVSVHGEPVIMHLNSSSSPIWSTDEDLPKVLDVDAAQVPGHGRGCQEAEDGEGGHDLHAAALQCTVAEGRAVRLYRGRKIRAVHTGLFVFDYFNILGFLL